MENRTLSREKDATESKVSGVLSSFVEEVESLENERDKLKEEVETLTTALTSAETQISELQKQINDRD